MMASMSGTSQPRARGPSRTPRRRAVLTGSTDITHDLREFRFRAEGEADFLPLDFADPMAARDLFEGAGYSILINNAGIIRRADSLDFTEDDWDAVMDVNLKAVFFTCQAFARAALAGRDAAAAYSYLGDLPGEEAAKLRGEAMSMLGQHSTAEGEFAEAGQTQAQLDAAWRAGNWTLVAQKGSETQKRFVELFAPETAPPAEPQDAVPPGPLSQAQQLISQSQSEREAFEKLMEELKTP